MVMEESALGTNPFFSREEQLLYQLQQSRSRAIIPQMIVTLLLSVIFYGGVLLNLSLLEVKKSTEQISQASTLIFLFLVLTLSIVLAARKAHAPYLFYRNHLVFQRKMVLFTTINNLAVKQDPLDKVFHTYSLSLYRKFSASAEKAPFRIRNIPQEIQLQQYVQQLVARAKGQESVC